LSSSREGARLKTKGVGQDRPMRRLAIQIKVVVRTTFRVLLGGSMPVGKARGGRGEALHVTGSDAMNGMALINEIA